MVKLSNLPKKRIILSMDPGTRDSFACAVIEQINKTGKCKLIESGILKHPISDLINPHLEGQKKLFTKEVRSLLKRFSPTDVVAERFMVRGRFMGASSEKISFMLGIVSSMVHPAKFTLLTASQWKNEFNRHFSNPIQKLYEACKGTPRHTIDASLIGYYYANIEGSKFEGWNLRFLILNK